MFYIEEEIEEEQEFERMLTVSEAAQLLGVSTSTVRRLTRMGCLRSYRIGPGGHRRFKKKDVLNILRSE
jgi:excisionase family DNA binding protein